jgi:hypothetical protein
VDYVYHVPDVDASAREGRGAEVTPKREVSWLYDVVGLGDGTWAMAAWACLENRDRPFVEALADAIRDRFGCRDREGCPTRWYSELMRRAKQP